MRPVLRALMVLTLAAGAALGAGGRAQVPPAAVSSAAPPPRAGPAAPIPYARLKHQPPAHDAAPRPRQAESSSQTARSAQPPAALAARSAQPPAPVAAQSARPPAPPPPQPQTEAAVQPA